MKQLFPFFILLFSGCAGLNPNLGERSADTFWHQGDVASAHGIIAQKANAGYPWAQLRLGVMYELGTAVDKNIPKAIEWYTKAANQKSTGGWAEGLLAGASGEQGYFNQNGDARIAQYQMANIYLQGNGVDKDPLKAYELIAVVAKETNGNHIFYCCEFAGGKYITADNIKNTFESAKALLSDAQLAEINAKVGL